MLCPGCQKPLPALDELRFCPRCGKTVALPDRFVGRVLGGQYELVRLLGEGGMGRVYLAHQRLGDEVREVAVKVLLDEYTDDPKIVARFMREVRLACDLRHPNTIQIITFGEEDGLLYIAMELIRGRRLSDEIHGGKVLPLDRVARILGQLCSSLAEAHELGIVHRDLKPDNIMLTTLGSHTDYVKVLDFGIAKKIAITDRSGPGGQLTKRGELLGTPEYMSPEQFGRGQVGPQSDIYALGVITYQLVTGRLPWNADGLGEWALHHLTVDPAPFEGGDAVPPGVQEAILRALAKKPEHRHATVSELFWDLCGDLEAPPSAFPLLEPRVAPTPVPDRGGEPPAAAPTPPPVAPQPSRAPAPAPRASATIIAASDEEELAASPPPPARASGPVAASATILLSGELDDLAAEDEPVNPPADADADEPAESAASEPAEAAAPEPAEIASSEPAGAPRDARAPAAREPAQAPNDEPTAPARDEPPAPSTRERQRSEPVKKPSRPAKTVADVDGAPSPASSAPGSARGAAPSSRPASSAPGSAPPSSRAAGGQRTRAATAQGSSPGAGVGEPPASETLQPFAPLRPPQSIAPAPAGFGWAHIALAAATSALVVLAALSWTRGTRDRDADLVVPLAPATPTAAAAGGTDAAATPASSAPAAPDAGAGDSALTEVQGELGARRVQLGYAPSWRPGEPVELTVSSASKKNGALEPDPLDEARLFFAHYLGEQIPSYEKAGLAGALGHRLSVPLPRAGKYGVNVRLRTTGGAWVAYDCDICVGDDPAQCPQIRPRCAIAPAAPPSARPPSTTSPIPVPIPIPIPLPEPE